MSLFILSKTLYSTNIKICKQLVSLQQEINQEGLSHFGFTEVLKNEGRKRLSQMSKSINRKVRKVPIAIGISQSSQSSEVLYSSFVYFACTLRSLRLKYFFETASCFLKGMIYKN